MRDSQRPLIEDGRKRYGTTISHLENQIRVCPKCKEPLALDEAHSGPWGNVWKCDTHGIISANQIVYNSLSNERDPQREGELQVAFEKGIEKDHKRNGHSGSFDDCKICMKALGNTGNYLAECGHCKANTEHDIKTHRCTICGAKNDNMANYVDEGQSKLLHVWVDGKCKTCGITKTENSAEMCNQTELAAFPAPGMKNAILNSVGEGRKKYGARLKNDNTIEYWKTKLAYLKKLLADSDPSKGWDRMTLTDQIRDAEEILKKLSGGK